MPETEPSRLPPLPLVLLFNGVILHLTAAGAGVIISTSGDVHVVNVPAPAPVAQQGEGGEEVESPVAARLGDAERRYEMIAPILDRAARTRAAVTARAEEVGVSPSTLYHYLERYDPALGVASLVYHPRRDVGAHRLCDQVEALILAALEACTAAGGRRNVQAISRDVAQQCLALNLDVPHPNTVRHRARQFWAATE